MNTYFRPLRSVLSVLPVLVWLVANPIHAESTPTQKPEQKSEQKPEAIQVAASIFPIYTLVQEVVGPLGQVYLLLEPSADPHSINLNFSQLRQLRSAQMFFYVGDGLESFAPALKKRLPSLHAIALAESAGIELLAARVSKPTADDAQPANHEDEEDHHDHHGHGDHGDAFLDYHIWLDPIQVTVLVEVIATTLAERYPDHRPALQANAKALIANINDLVVQMRDAIKPVSDRAFLPYHDAYQYLEKFFGLNSVGFVTDADHSKPSIRHIQGLRALVEAGQVDCVILAPLASDAMVETLLGDSEVTRIWIDPLGGNQPQGSSYTDLLQEWSDQLSSCGAP